jgi:hypothetical protein
LEKVERNIANVYSVSNSGCIFFFDLLVANQNIINFAIRLI